MPPPSRSETASDLTWPLVHELARWRGLPVVTSIYLDVDGRRHPRRSDLGPEIAHLVRGADDLAAPLGPAVGAAVKADLGHVHRWLADSFDRPGLRGVAMFSCDSSDLFCAIGLSTPVREQVAVGPTPALAQLCQTLERGTRALLVLADRSGSRLVRLEQHRMDEHAGPSDEPPHQVDTDLELGSFDRFQAEESRRHFRRVADAVRGELALWPAQHLVLGGPGSAVDALERALPPSVAALVIGRIAVPMTSSPASLAPVAWEVVEAFDERGQQTIVDDLCQRVERELGGVAGVGPTLDALADDRVAKLVVASGFAHPGGWCPLCARPVATAGRELCPGCGRRTEPLADVIEAAIASALSRNVEVEVCDGTALDLLGGIGAVEHYIEHY